MGFKVIKENEQILLFNRQGSGRPISGPLRVSLRSELSHPLAVNTNACLYEYLNTVLSEVSLEDGVHAAL